MMISSANMGGGLATDCVIDFATFHPCGKLEYCVLFYSVFGVIIVWKKESIPL
jgi:hypothetical protein